MAEENINIATIDIDVNKFIKSAAQAKAEINKLTKANQDLRKAGEGSSEEFVQNEIALKNLRTSYRQNTEAASALESATKDLTNATNFEKKSVQEVTNERAKFIKLSKSIKGDTDAEIAQRNKLNQIIDAQTDFIRENSSSYADNKDRIGEYRDAINNSILSNTKLGQILNQGIEIYEKTSATVNQAIAATKAQEAANTALGGSTTVVKNGFAFVNIQLKLFRLALISTGIGALLVALGSLVAFLTSTQEGVDKVNKIMRPLKEIFKETLGILQDFGKVIFDAFSKPKKLITDIGIAITSQLIQRFEAVGKIIKGIITLNQELIDKGVAQNAKANKEITDKVNEVTKSVTNRYDEAFKRGQRLADLDKQIEVGQNNMILRESKLSKEIKAANKDAEDTTKTLKEREAAAKRSVDISRQLLKEQQSLKDLEIERSVLEAQANDTSRKDQGAINKLISERDDLETQALELQTTQTNKINTIRREAEAKAKQAQAEQVRLRDEAFNKAIQQANDELDLFITQQGTRAKTLQQEVNIAQEVARQKTAILDSQRKAGKVSETAYQAELLKINQEFLAVQTEASIDNAMRELESQRMVIEQTILNEQEKNNRLAEVEREYQEKRLEQGVINEQEYNQAINEINEQNRLSNEELRLEREQIDKENRLAIEVESLAEQFERDKTRLAEQRDLELAQAQRTGADVNAINEKFAQFELQLDQKKKDQKIAIAASGLNALSEILGKESKAGKAVAIAQSLINTYQGITSALKLPYPQNLIAAVSTGAVGFKAVLDITKTKTPSVPKAERGLLTGKSHSQGGQIIEAEGGESIINKRSTSMFMPLLSAINQAGGGVGFARSGTMVGGQMFSGGIGATAKFSNMFINYEKIGSAVAQGVSMLPPPQVAITEIRDANDNYSQVVERANI